MLNRMGITQKGLKTALKIKEDYRANRPILMPGKKTHILEPETVMNEDIDLFNLEDPLPLAMIATRDPEAPMAVAAATVSHAGGAYAAGGRGECARCLSDRYAR